MGEERARASRRGRGRVGRRHKSSQGRLRGTKVASKIKWLALGRNALLFPLAGEHKGEGGARTMCRNLRGPFAAATREERENDDGRAKFRPVRSGAGKRFLRGRFYCRHQGPQIAPDRRGRADHPGQSRASRRGRRRSARRRRRRHFGADAAQILRQESRRARLRSAAARALRRRRAVSAARRSLAAGDHGHLRGGWPRRKA